MICLLYDTETGIVCYKQWLNKPHNPEEIELIISELAPEFDNRKDVVELVDLIAEANKLQPAEEKEDRHIGQAER